MAVIIDIIDQPQRTFGKVSEHKRTWIWPAVLLLVSTVTLTIVMSISQNNLMNSITTQMSYQGNTQAFLVGQQEGMPPRQGAAPSGDLGADAQEALSTGQQGTAGDIPQGAYPPDSQATFTGAASATPLVTIALKFGLLLTAWLLVAGLGYLLTRLFRGQANFQSLFAVGVLASIPFLYRNITQLAYYWVTKRTIVSQGIAFLAPSQRGIGSTLVTLLLSNIDVFFIWFIILLGTGVAVNGQMKAWKAAIITVVIVSVIVGIRLLPTLFGLGINIPVLG